MIIWLITGLWILLGCAEAAHLITIMTNRSLQTYTALFSVFVLAGLLAYTGLCILVHRRSATQKMSVAGAIGKMSAAGMAGKSADKAAKKRRERSFFMLCFAVLAVITVYRLLAGYVPDLQDAGNVASGSIMTVHPFLVTVTENAMPMRMQILGLSSLYSALITISKQSPYIIMCKVVPLAVWGLSILLYWTFAKKLFPEDVHKRWLFVSMVAFVYLATSGSTGLVGQRLFYAGFSGETIRGALLMPYTVYVTW